MSPVTTNPDERPLDENARLAARVTLITHLEKGLHVPESVESPADAREYVLEAYEEAGIDVEASQTLADEAVDRVARWTEDDADA